MAGLVLKLNPKERVLINGAVIENGDKRSRLSIVTPNANILRLRDAIRPHEAQTPVKRVCYIAQLILSGDASAEEGTKQLSHGIEQLSQVFLDIHSQSILNEATTHINNQDFYKALKILRTLIQREARLLSVN